MIGEDIGTVSLTREQYSVYSCLSYFQVFHHPLTLQEIYEFSGCALSLSELQLTIREMLGMNLLHEDSGYFCTKPSFGYQIRKREQSEFRFRKQQKKIRRFARLVAGFPFVESLAISGSCSKGLLDEKGDVDYFLITSPGRLWLCRTLLILFKKVFLLNSKKYFCVNYFISKDSLEIPDHNLFVASEIKTLMPVSNPELFDRFLENNRWASDHLPNKLGYTTAFLLSGHRKKIHVCFLQYLLRNTLGDRLESLCYSMTYNTWKRRYARIAQSDFELNFRSSQNVSKHHPRGFQRKVLGELQKKLSHIRVQTQ